MFKPIKSPVGEVVGDEACANGTRYMTESTAVSMYRWTGYIVDDPDITPCFADWLEAQGVRLV